MSKGPESLVPEKRITNNKYIYVKVQYHYPVGKCKSKSQDINSLLFQWLLLKRQKVTNTGKDMGKREFLHTWMGMKISAITMDNSVEISLKTGNRLAI